MAAAPPRERASGHRRARARRQGQGGPALPRHPRREEMVQNWFQNKRARPPPRERRRMFAARKLRDSSAEGHPFTRIQEKQDETLTRSQPAAAHGLWTSQPPAL
nr:cytoplasmic polyadenylated homeobox-like protein [Symphalangus syndactylus]